MKSLKRHIWFVLDSIDTNKELALTDLILLRPIELATTGWQIRDCIAKQVNDEKHKG